MSTTAIGRTLALAAVLVAHAAAAAPTAEQKCQGAKSLAAGKYVACRLKAEKGLATTSDMVKYNEALTKCADKLSRSWQKAIDAATADGATCPDAPLTESQHKAVIDVQCQDIAAALGGGGYSSDGAVLPKSGNTTAFGAGSDGDVQAGVARSYSDNLDGTITDNVTGLMWEKKDDSGGTHDQDTIYTWGSPSPPNYTMNGTMVTTFLATLNAGSGFAGHTDWRIPNMTEIQSLVDWGENQPSVAPEFNTCAGCTDVTSPSCSCTAASYYWSSTTVQDFSGYAWVVSFYDGNVINASKDVGRRVRAVRGGL